MSKNQTEITPFRSIQATIQNKRASTYVKWVCIILFLIILVAFMMSFMIAVDTAEGHRAYAKHALDSYTEEHSIEIYGAVKQNKSNATERIQLQAEIQDVLISKLGLVKTGTNEFSKLNESGGTLYYVTMSERDTVQMRQTRDKTVQIRLAYTLTVPVTFMGTNTVWVDIPMEIISEFTPKF